MPVRVRCPKCAKAINAPDGARGKAIKCPECETRVPVPVDDEVASTAPAKPATKPPAKPASKPSAKPPAKTETKKKSLENDDNFLAKLDLSRSEDQDAKICPKCGAEVDEEDEECAACGIDLRTGGLGKAAKKAKMKGPDPSDFYGKAWKEGAQFVKDNFNIALKTWSNLIFFACVAWFFGLLSITAQQNDHTPTYYFFMVLSVLGTLGMIGWPMVLATKVIQFGLEKQSVLDRTPFDAFASIAMGISWVVWAVAAAAPFSIFIIPAYLFTRDQGEAVNIAVTAATAAFFIGLPIPCAMAHRAMPVTWKIWVSPLLWKMGGQTAGGLLFTWLIAFCVGLPVLGLYIGEILLARAYLVPSLYAFGLKGIAWKENINILFALFYSAPEAVAAGTAEVGTTAAIFILLGLILLKVVTLFAATIWMMYMFRVVALYTFYNRKGLELISHVKERKYVAKEKLLGPDGEPLDEKTSAGKAWATGLLGTVLFYVIANVILSFVAPGYLLMPRPLAVLFRLAAPQ